MAIRIPAVLSLAPAAAFFTANDDRELDRDLGSPVSLNYFDIVPVKYNGIIGRTMPAYSE